MEKEITTNLRNYVPYVSRQVDDDSRSNISVSKRFCTTYSFERIPSGRV